MLLAAIGWNNCGLNLTVHVYVSLQLADARSRRLSITNQSVCARTGNKLGTSAFMWLPDQSTVLSRTSTHPRPRPDTRLTLHTI